MRQDGYISHTLTIYDGLIFDSVLPHPMKLLKQALDWSCNCKGGMAYVEHAIKLYFSTIIQFKYKSTI